MKQRLDDVRMLMRAGLRDRRGATAIEYCLLVALLGLVVYAAVGAMQREGLTVIFNAIQSALQSISPPGGA